MTKTSADDGVSDGGATPGTGQPTMENATRWARFLGWCEALILPYGKWVKELVDPLTLTLIVFAVFLMRVDPKSLDQSIYSFLQVVTALVTGFVGARVSAAVLASSQDGKLYASGRAAVRGLQLILRKTVALERRVALFVEQSHKDLAIEERALVSQRNLDEVLESVRTLQVEIAGSIDSWEDVVPGADVASIFLAVSGLQDRVAEKESQLREAIESRAGLESKGNADSELIRQASSRIAELEEDKRGLQGDLDGLKKSAELPLGSIVDNASAATALYILHATKRSRAADEKAQRDARVKRNIDSLRAAGIGSSESGIATEEHPLPE